MIVKFREVGNSIVVTVPKDMVAKPLKNKITIKSLFANYTGDYKPTEIDLGESKGMEII